MSAATASKKIVKKSVRSAPQMSYNVEHIEPKTLEQIVNKLAEMKIESEDVVNAYVHADLSRKETSEDVGDDVDHASRDRDREFGLIMHQRHLKRLQQIDEAFNRMKDGSYGLCEGTDEPINPKRLMIMPLARFGLDYQKRQEQLLGRGLGNDTIEESSFTVSD